MKRTVKAWTYIMADGKWCDGAWHIVECYSTKGGAELALRGAYAIQIVPCTITYDDGKRAKKKEGK